MAQGPEDEVLLAAARLAMAVSLRAADAIGEVSAVQLRAVTVLAARDGAKLVDLAEELGVTVSTASRLVDRLVAAGLVDRRRSVEVRREIRLSLTPAGREMLDRYDGVRLSTFRDSLGHLGPDERQSVIAALGALVQSNDQAQRPELSCRAGSPVSPARCGGCRWSPRPRRGRSCPRRGWRAPWKAPAWS